MKNNDVALVANIKKIIDEKGIKQCKIASRIGMSGAEFSRMLNGRKVVRACYVPAIAEALGVSPNDLFADIDTKAV